MMKSLLILFFILANIMFLPSSTLARALYENKSVIGGSNDPNKPAVPCPPNMRYSGCLPSKSPPRKPCKPYERNCRPQRKM